MFPSGSTGRASFSAPASKTPLADSMRKKITEALQPVKLVIEDESAAHAGHAAMRASAGKASGSGETHFKVAVVSAAFEGQPLIKRHRMINQLLMDEFASGLHALSLDTKTPTECDKSG